MVLSDIPAAIGERLRGITRQQWVIGGLSVLMTTLMVVAFVIENRWGYMKPQPVIAYFSSWQAGRSDADALADQRKAQARAAAEKTAAAATSAAPSPAPPAAGSPTG